MGERDPRRMLRDDTPDTGCGIKLFEREAFLDLPYFDHMHRYLPALMQRAGWKTVSVPVNHRHRTAGVSKYNNLNRALVGIRDLRGVAWLIVRSRRTAVEELPRMTPVAARRDEFRHSVAGMDRYPHEPVEADRLVGALMFGGRWLVQFIASKRQGKPVIPRLFWYMSILGSLMTLAYFIFGKNDAVGILQNLFPSFTACYSLYLDIKHRGWHRDRNGALSGEKGSCRNRNRFRHWTVKLHSDPFLIPVSSLLRIAPLACCPLPIRRARGHSRPASTLATTFEAIYKAEWDWRTQQAPSWDEDSDNSGARHRPGSPMSARGAGEAACLPRWRAQATRRHRRQHALPCEPGELRGLPPATRAHGGGVARARLRDAVQRRQLVLVRPRLHGPRRPARCRSLPRLCRAPARRAALLRPADREHARRPGTRLQRAARGAGRPRRLHRDGGGVEGHRVLQLL
jgi:lipid-A-disaccharide synthase-like uncharacterized protein